MRMVRTTVLVALFALPVATSVAQPPSRGIFDAVQIATPGFFYGCGVSAVEGWEFHSTADLTVTHLGLYDYEGDGLARRHEVAIWDISNSSEPVAQQTVPAGKIAPIADSFRFVPIRPVKLSAFKSYAIVAFYPDHGKIRNPDAKVEIGKDDTRLKLKYAPHLEIHGQRQEWPQAKMAFPTIFKEGSKYAIIGPSFRYQVAR
jgi:hypothetical protein